MHKLKKYQTPAGPLGLQSPTFNSTVYLPWQMKANGYAGNYLPESIIYPTLVEQQKSAAEKATENISLFPQSFSAQNTAAQEQSSGSDDKKSFKEKWYNFVGNSMEPAMNAIGNTAGVVGNLTGKSDTSSSMYSNQIADAVSKLGPYGAAAGAVMKFGNAINDALGTQADIMSNNIASHAGLSSGQRLAANVGSTLLGFIPGIGAMSGAKNFSISQDAASIGSGYGGSMSRMQAAEEASGKNFLFGGRRVQSMMTSARADNDLMTSIGLDQKQRISSAPQNAQSIASNNYRQANGVSAGTMTAGKAGLKLPDREYIMKLIKLSARLEIPKEEENIESFADGGKIGIDVNVFPEGALHATKNHLEEVNPELDEVTEKGIPVVVTDENGDYEQVAEIEREEIIFTKELTNKIEELWKDGSREAMLEAGKILADELTNNINIDGQDSDKSK